MCASWGGARGGCRATAGCRLAAAHVERQARQLFIAWRDRARPPPCRAAAPASGARGASGRGAARSGRRSGRASGCSALTAAAPEASSCWRRPCAAGRGADQARIGRRVMQQRERAVTALEEGQGATRVALPLHCHARMRMRTCRRSWRSVMCCCASSASLAAASGSLRCSTTKLQGSQGAAQGRERLARAGRWAAREASRGPCGACMQFRWLQGNPGLRSTVLFITVGTWRSLIDSHRYGPLLMISATPSPVLHLEEVCQLALDPLAAGRLWGTVACTCAGSAHNEDSQGCLPGLPVLPSLTYTAEIRMVLQGTAPAPVQGELALRLGSARLEAEQRPVPGLNRHLHTQ